MTFLTKVDTVMLFVKPLTEAEKVTLSDAHKYHPQRWTRIRAHCILLSAQGFEIKEIASIYSICRQAVSNSIHDWETFGFLGLVDKYRSGRPKLLKKAQEDDLINRVMASPRSLKKVLAEFSKVHQIEITIDTLKRLCKAAGMSWKRVRKSLKNKRNEDDFNHSKNLINHLIAESEAEKINLLYFDESGFSLVPCIPYAWQPLGEYIEVPSSRSKNLNVLGFLSRDCKFESFVFTGSITTEVVIACFEQMAENSDINKPSIVLVDNASTHTSDKFDKKTIDWCKRGLIVVPISKYSPELNIIEILWRKIKYEWMPFSAYESFQSLETGLFDILKNIGTKFKVNFC